MYYAHTIGGDPWGDWCDSTTTTTTASNTAGVIWTTWASSATTSTATNTATSSIYRIWVTQSSTGWTQSGSSGQRIVQPYRQTPQEAAEARRRHEEYRERQKVEAERYRLAKERAEGLLYEHLTDEQRAQLKREKFFVVQGGKTGRSYRINAGGGLVANVHEVDAAGRVQRRLCAHIDHAVNSPVWDHFLAQKLMLEHQEEAFLKVANDHGR